MNVNYQQLFSLELKHDYFNQDQPNQLYLRPSFETEQIMQQAGILMRPQGNNIMFFAPESFDLAGYIKANPDIRLKFKLNSPDLSFINYTELSTDIGKTLVFTNETSEAIQALSSAEIENVSQESQLVSVDLSLEQLAASVGGEAIQYSLQLKNRSVIWRYYIINNPQSSATFGLSGKGSDLFPEAVDATLLNGQVAKMFSTSPNLIPLKSVYGLALKLEISAADSNSTKSMLLPLAGAESIRLEKEGDQNVFYANMYVYL